MKAFIFNRQRHKIYFRCSVFLIALTCILLSFSLTSIAYADPPPHANNDAYLTAKNTPLTEAAPGVLANDTDPRDHPLTAVLHSNPAHGTVALHADGSFTYTPVQNYTGSDTFTYRANNSFSNSNTATVTIRINSPPVGVDDIYSTNKNTTLNVTAPGVLTNDTDAEGDSLSAHKVSDPLHGTLALNANGSFTYTPATGYTGTDSFTYKANDSLVDSNSATVTITINAVNHAPVVVNDSYVTPQDTALNVAAPGVLGNDTDADGDALNSIKLSDPLHGTLTLNSNGSFTYTPVTGYTGTDSFTYKANDGVVDSNSATVTITINAVNHAPMVVNDSYVTPLDTALNVAAPGVLGNDSDADGDTLNALKVSDPLHGTLTLNANGSFTYTPVTAYTGTDSFTYKAYDGLVDSNAVTVTITINAVNHAPSFTGGANQTILEDSVPQTISNWATQISAGPSAESGQLLNFIIVSNSNPGLFAVAPALSPTGTLTFTPATNAVGTATISITLHDNGGTTNGGIDTSAPQSFTITINPVNDPPGFTKGADQTVVENSGPQTVTGGRLRSVPDLPMNQGRHSTLSLSVTAIRVYLQLPRPSAPPEH